MYYPMTSSISNGLVALYGSDERIINNNNNTPAVPPMMLQAAKRGASSTTAFPFQIHRQ